MRWRRRAPPSPALGVDARRGPGSRSRRASAPPGRRTRADLPPHRPDVGHEAGRARGSRRGRRSRPRRRGGRPCRPGTVSRSSPSRAATARSCASWAGEASRTVTRAPAAASTGPCWPPPGGEREDAPSPHVAEPLRRDGARRGEHDRPVALAGPRDDLGADRDGPAVARPRPRGPRPRGCVAARPWASSGAVASLYRRDPMDSSPPDLARQVDHAQSIHDTPAAAQAARLERAVAATCRSIALAMARLDPACGAGGARPAGRDSPSSPGRGARSRRRWRSGPAGPSPRPTSTGWRPSSSPGGTGTPQVELCPFADPTAAALLAARGYRIDEWQLVWTRVVAGGAGGAGRSAARGVEVRRVRPARRTPASARCSPAFLESEEVPDDAVASCSAPARTPGGTSSRWRCRTASRWAGPRSPGRTAMALVNGSGVRPAFRRRGAQGALIRARLDRARELGCGVAASTTQPGTPSRRNMERHGFHVAYPKLVLLRDRPARATRGRLTSPAWRGGGRRAAARARSARRRSRCCAGSPRRRCRSRCPARPPRPGPGHLAVRAQR